MAIPNFDFSSSTAQDTIDNHTYTDLVTNRILSGVMNNLVICKYMRMEEAQDFDGSVGTTVKVNRPMQFTTERGRRVSTWQRPEQGRWNVTIDDDPHVPINLTSWNKRFYMRQFLQEVIDPQAMSLAQDADSTCAESVAKGGYHYIDFTSDSTTYPDGVPEERKHVSPIVTTLVKLGVPNMGMNGFVTHETLDSLVSFITTLDNQGMVKGAYDNYYKTYNIAGVNWRATQNIYRHTVGAYGDSNTLRIDGANQHTAVNVKTVNANDLDTQTLKIDGFTASAEDVLNQGDIIKISGVKKVNLMAGKQKQTLTDDMSFVVTSENNDANASGESTVTIRPAMVIEGAYQNVSAAPADNATVTVVGDSGSSRYENVMFRRDAHSFVSVAPESSGNGAGVRQRTMTKQNLSVRYGHAYDLAGDNHQTRADLWFGTGYLDGNQVVRILTDK